MEKGFSKNHRFFTDLPPVRQFSQIFSSPTFEEAPSDWYLVMTDVINSPLAIENGRYREVVTVSGLVAMALANLEKGLHFPVVFSGDAVTALLPPDQLAEARSVLADVRGLAKNLFNLELRVGLIPIQDLFKAGQAIQVAKFRVSPFYDQAILDGTGVEHAEKLLKARDSSGQYLLPPDEPVTLKANLEGYTCRWEPALSPAGETISLTIKVRPGSSPNREVAGRILQQLETILGQNYHPIRAESLRSTLGGKVLGVEGRVKSGERASLKTWAATWEVRLAVLSMRIAEFFHVPLRHGHVVLSQAKTFVVLSTDYRKFDGAIKLVLSTTTETRQILETYLDGLVKDRLIEYGLQISNGALLTSLVHARSQREVHFADGAGGGLALAAKQLKLHLAEE